MTFEAIAEEVLGNPRLAISGAMAQATRTALRYFRETHGDPWPKAITRRHVSEWLDLLSKRPSKPATKDKRLPIRELVDRYSDKPLLPRLKGKSLSMNLTSLSSVWAKAQKEGLIDYDLTNPFQKHTVNIAPPTETPTEFDVEELKAIFSLPVFTDGDRPKGGRGEACYWVPLLLLWTGARPEEICQLMTSDVSQDPETKRWLLRITDEGVHPHKGQRKLKTSRTLSGRRTFPIPQELIRLGFIDYVAFARDAGETALFPALRIKGERGTLYDSFGIWWRGYLNENIGFPTGEGRKASREFRHLWSSAARRSGISMEAMEYIQGHSTSQKSANVRYGSRVSLGLEVDKLAFAGLDLSNVKPWKSVT